MSAQSYKEFNKEEYFKVFPSKDIAIVRRGFSLYRGFAMQLNDQMLMKDTKLIKAPGVAILIKDNEVIVKYNSSNISEALRDQADVQEFFVLAEVLVNNKTFSSKEALPILKEWITHYLKDSSYIKSLNASIGSNSTAKGRDEHLYEAANIFDIFVDLFEKIVRVAKPHSLEANDNSDEANKGSDPELLNKANPLGSPSLWSFSKSENGATEVVSSTDDRDGGIKFFDYHSDFLEPLASERNKLFYTAKNKNERLRSTLDWAKFEDKLYNDYLKKVK